MKRNLEREYQSNQEVTSPQINNSFNPSTPSICSSQETLLKDWNITEVEQISVFTTTDSNKEDQQETYITPVNTPSNQINPSNQVTIFNKVNMLASPFIKNTFKNNSSTLRGGKRRNKNKNKVAS